MSKVYYCEDCGIKHNLPAEIWDKEPHYCIICGETGRTYGHIESKTLSEKSIPVFQKQEDLYVQHVRIKQENQQFPGRFDVFPCGGATVAARVEVHPDGNRLMWGVAVCNENDGFVKRTGYNKAVGRTRAKDAMTSKVIFGDDLHSVAFHLGSNAIRLAKAKHLPGQVLIDWIINSRSGTKN